MFFITRDLHMIQLSMQLPSTQLPIVFINLNYMATCFDQRLIIFRPVRDVIIKLHLHKHDVHLCTYRQHSFVKRSSCFVLHVFTFVAR